MFYVYIIRNSLNKLYIGVSKNPNIRVFDHNHRQGAKFTKYKTNFEIVFIERYYSIKEARAREIQIKKWRREKKEFLIGRYKKNLSTKLQ